MKIIVTIFIALLCGGQILAGVGDKAGGSKGNSIVIDSMKVNFQTITLPLHRTCLTRENKLQAIDRPELVTSREYRVKNCVRLTSYHRAEGGCELYETKTREYPDQFEITKWRITGRFSGKDKDDSKEFAGKETRELPFCDDL